MDFLMMPEGWDAQAVVEVQTAADVMSWISLAWVVGFALVVSLVLPRRNPNFPGRHVGALLLVAGWRARWAAWALILFVAVATFAAHRFWEFDASQYRNQMNHFLKNLALIGGLLFVVAFGPGRMAVDKS